jgi:y4mF family transcriptional regulator
MLQKIPNGNSTGFIMNIQDIADLVRERRKLQRLTQKEMAGLCRVGVRFISDLENAKPTIHMGKALHVLRLLGIKLKAG